MTATPKHLLLAEDHPMTRMGLKLMLEQDSDRYTLVAEVSNGQQALETVAALMASPTPVQLVLMDIGMPEMDGIEATQKLKAQWPNLPVLMLTSKDNPTEVKAAMAAGADGYCLKGLEFDQLKLAMDAVLEGNMWLDKHIARSLLADLQTPTTNATAVQTTMASTTVATPANRGMRNPLTEREMEILGLIVEGLNNPQISARLYISLATTKAHVHSILQKLCLDDRTQAAVWALRNGYASL
jgi:two-component system, NarL family, response regulator LiaR